MLTMDIMLGTLLPHAAPLLTVGAGTVVAMIAFLALALTAVAGTARELGKTDPDVVAPGRSAGPAETRRLAA